MFLQMMSLFEIILKRNIKINLYLIKKQIHVIGEYIIRGAYNACCIIDARCVRIYNYCICHCMPGYILEGEMCLKSKITFLLNKIIIKYKRYKKGVEYHKNTNTFLCGD